MESNDRFLPREEVEALVGLRRSSIYRLMRTTPPSFPLPFRIGGRHVRWRLSEVQAFLESCPRATGEADAR